MSTQTRPATILVPIDFSALTAVAIAHAVNYAKLIGSEISLIHFVEKGIGTSEAHVQLELGEASMKLENLADDIFTSHGIKTGISVRTGDFKDGIGEAAIEAKAMFVVMATKGIHGMQRWTGSNAIKSIGDG